VDPDGPRASEELRDSSDPTEVQGSLMTVFGRKYNTLARSGLGIGFGVGGGRG
jgi:hypothetical protein